MNLQYADLSGATAIQANFESANLNAATINWCDWSRAILNNADLLEAAFRRVNLAEADLRGANLREATLSHVRLSKANLTNARLYSTTLDDIDVSDVVGLGTVQHAGPSTIGIDTIYLSKGKIPEVFLRGVGVPETFITYMKSLVANPIEYHSCFISYSSKDQEFAERLRICSRNTCGAGLRRRK